MFKTVTLEKEIMEAIEKEATFQGAIAIVESMINNAIARLKVKVRQLNNLSKDNLVTFTLTNKAIEIIMADIESLEEFSSEVQKIVAIMFPDEE